MADNIFGFDEGSEDNLKHVGTTKNIPDIITNATKQLTKDLSGVGTVSKKKIIDNIITFVGLAGGVGTSTLVANIAKLLNKQGFSVLVVDLNIMYPIQHSLFDIKQEVEKKDLFSYLVGQEPLGDCIEYKNKSLGVMVANNRTLVNYIDTDCKEASNNLLEMLDRVCNLFDVVLIDANLRIDYDIINTALYKSDFIYCVMDENVECVSNYNRFKNGLQSSGVDNDNIHVIMNKRTNIFYGKTAEKFKMDVIGVLPFDTAIIESGLKSEIFCVKGASASKNAGIFINRLKEIKDKILELSGYMRDTKKEQEE